MCQQREQTKSLTDKESKPFELYQALIGLQEGQFIAGDILILNKWDMRIFVEESSFRIVIPTQGTGLPGHEATYHLEDLQQPSQVIKLAEEITSVYWVAQCDIADIKRGRELPIELIDLLIAVGEKTLRAQPDNKPFGKIKELIDVVFMLKDFSAHLQSGAVSWSEAMFFGQSLGSVASDIIRAGGSFPEINE